MLVNNLNDVKMTALKQKTGKKGDWFGSPTPCLDFNAFDVSAGKLLFIEMTMVAFIILKFYF